MHLKYIDALFTLCGPVYRRRYSDSLWAGQSGNRILVGSEIFCTHPDWPWGPPRFLYSGYHVSCLGVKWLGHGIDHPLPSGAEVKERVELYLYSPSGMSCPVLGSTKNNSHYCAMLRIEIPLNWCWLLSVCVLE